jgi:membrane associated rhomboid family serine protease
MTADRRSLRYTVTRPRELTPYATYALIILCVIAFAAELASEDFVNLFAFDAEQPAPWMFVTSIFLHADIGHIFWNMFMLYMFGTVLEKIIGHRDYVALFILAGIAGNIGYMLFCEATGEFNPSLGASGAIYGVFACLAVLYPDLKVYLFFFIPMKIIFVLFMFAAVDILFMSTGDNIAHAAHLAGLLVGLLFAWYIKREAASFKERFGDPRAYVEVRYSRQDQPPSDEEGFL